MGLYVRTESEDKGEKSRAINYKDRSSLIRKTFKRKHPEIAEREELEFSRKRAYPYHKYNALRASDDVRNVVEHQRFGSEEQPILETNKGNQMLRSMGWTPGER